MVKLTFSSVPGLQPLILLKKYTTTDVFLGIFRHFQTSCFIELPLKVKATSYFFVLMLLCWWKIWNPVFTIMDFMFLIEIFGKRNSNLLIMSTDVCLSVFPIFEMQPEISHFSFIGAEKKFISSCTKSLSPRSKFRLLSCI